MTLDPNVDRLIHVARYDHAGQHVTHANFYEWREDNGQRVHRVDIGCLDREGIFQVTDTFVTTATTLADAINTHDPDEVLIWDEVDW